MTTQRLAIDFHFDLVCPWCLIGVRHLFTALSCLHSENPAIDVGVNWHSQILLPDIPPGGLDYQSFYERRLGSAAAVSARRAQVNAAASAAGLRLAFEKIQRMPNTTLAHGLIARVAGRHPEHVGGLIERLLTAFFIEGMDIGDPAILAGIGAEFGDEPDSATYTTPKRGRTVPGVPHLVIGSQHISGAQPPDVLLQALQSFATTD